ncbi:MAG: glycoside hydrolase family 65 protein [Tenericutes bacterium]|nr:glycoside hydrolase family 65 protein [Mycoplasmatota bacterium]
MSVLEHNKFIAEEQESIGSKFLISNGYMGYRGTLDEAESADFVALNLAGLYDGSRFIENVNVFNPLYTMVKADGIDLNPRSFRPTKHNISINTDNGLFKRSTKFVYGPTEITVKSERFMDQTNKSMIYSKFSFVSNNICEVELFTGIDSFIWNIEEHHLVDTKRIEEEDLLILASKTKHGEKDVCVGLKEVRNFNAKGKAYKNGIKKFIFKLEAKKEYTIYKYVGVVHSIEDSVETLKRYLMRAEAKGYKQLFDENKDFWDKTYEDAKLNVFNNDEVMAQADYAVYQLISHRPFCDEISIPQKGLSGQYDMGSVNWNTEILLLPFYVNTDPVSARHMVMYRINSLPEAMNKAKNLGFEGAFYAEKSGENGMELSKTAIQNNIHINGSIVYGIYQYVERTKDYSVLFEGGLDMLLECSRFYLSYASLSDNKKHYDFLNVTGLDNVHTDIDNDAYTNLIIKNCLDSVIKCVAFAKGEDKFKVKDMFEPKSYESLISDLRELRRKLYVKKNNIEYLLESFDRYFNLEDRDVSTLKRISFIEELDVENIEETTYLKNPGVIASLALFLDEYSNKIKRVNYDYYLRRTINPDMFTRIMYVIIGCTSEETEEAYKQYLDLADISIGNDFLFKEGLNLALLGGIYDMLVYGFAGLRHHGFLLSGDYNNATKIRRLEFKVKIASNIANVKTKRNSVTVSFKEE